MECKNFLQPRTMQEIADEVAKVKLKITVLQEVRWRGYGKIRKKCTLL
jgi:hypothetical protein